MNHCFRPAIATLLGLSTLMGFAADDVMKYDFSDSGQTLNTVGRGIARVENGVYTSKDSYATFGNPEWRDYELTFKARTPKADDPVQIWAGFRAANHHDRYMIGLRGGLQNDVILMRLGYLGTEEFLGERPLRFHPVPGEWYNVRIQVCGDRIRVFIGEEKLPYIDIVDKNAYLIKSGEVLLGGGWIETEFDNLEIRPLSADALKDVAKKEYGTKLTKEQRVARRKAERASYAPVNVPVLRNMRTDISLDDKWLFIPDYEQKEATGAVEPDADDSKWHVMTVPSFWNPSRIWLHGETMPRLFHLRNK